MLTSDQKLERVDKVSTWYEYRDPKRLRETVTGEKRAFISLVRHYKGYPSLNNIVIANNNKKREFYQFDFKIQGQCKVRVTNMLFGSKSCSLHV
jgi:hypothetical protein